MKIVLINIIELRANKFPPRLVVGANILSLKTIPNEKYIIYPKL